MQSTTNYSMNLVEGTDIVNVPVQLNPNFQTIDQEMFANKQGTIGTATEVVTGTVHAIVRANVDSDMFRFTATGAWTSGDTMTLDGSAVTVHLADGTAPATGVYIIGAEVVAVVNGTLVTLLTSAAQPVAGVTSFNSRTGAVVPTASDYDATMIDYDNTISGLTATDIQGAVDEIEDQIQNLPTGDYTVISGTGSGDFVTAFGALTNAQQTNCSISLNTTDGGYVFHCATTSNVFIMLLTGSTQIVSYELATTSGVLTKYTHAYGSSTRQSTTITYTNWSITY